MKKPVPSRKEAIPGLIVTAVMVLFGVFWTVGAYKESGLFALFGIFWIGFVIIGAVPAFKAVFGGKSNGKTDNITGFTKTDKEDFSENSKDSSHCPYCGERLIGENKFCTNCGKRL